VSRVQLALNVADLDAAVAFYSKLFDTEPAKRRPGYANFAVAEPPLKLVLIENPAGSGEGMVGALNHLGVEVATSEEVLAATSRLADEGLAPTVEDSTTCCYAVQGRRSILTITYAWVRPDLDTTSMPMSSLGGVPLSRSNDVGGATGPWTSTSAAVGADSAASTDSVWAV
jgi:catechol 2,3-dioxygenase-like lactoylglutathione lyase family enzyme